MPKGTYNHGHKTVLIDGQRIDLTHAEHTVFMDLWNARGGYRTTEQLFDALYSDADNPDLLIRAYLNRLRDKLKPTDFRIQNQYGRGYWLSRLPEVIHMEHLSPSVSMVA